MVDRILRVSKCCLTFVYRGKCSARIWCSNLRKGFKNLGRNIISKNDSGANCRRRVLLSQYSCWSLNFLFHCLKHEIEEEEENNITNRRNTRREIIHLASCLRLDYFLCCVSWFLFQYVSEMLFSFFFSPSFYVIFLFYSFLYLCFKLCVSFFSLCAVLIGVARSPLFHGSGGAQIIFKSQKGKKFN